MALDNEFFDSINIEVVKKKYYNANKVEAVFQTIREEAEALQTRIDGLNEEKAALMRERAALVREKAALEQENSDMKSQVSILDRQKDDLSNAILTAREICNRMIEEAQQKASDVIANAEAEKRQIIREALLRQDYSVRKMEESFARLREIQLASIDTLNAEWQSFLAEMPDEEPADLLPPEPAPAPVPVAEPVPPLFAGEEAEEEEAEEEEPAEKEPTVDDIPIPDDLADKVSSIVDQILAMHNAFDMDGDDI